MIKSNLLEEIEDNLETVDMSLIDDSWHSSIPSTPGWYFIETNTPPEVFEKVDPPRGKYHYDLPKKAKASILLRELGMCILPENDPFYIVYSGEARNLRVRAKEHVSGHEKTYCLALENYPVFLKYEWKFRFAPCPYGDSTKESKVLRIYGEQMWRVKHGWPILCQK